jgi:PhoH-like ATPase
MGQKTYVLDTNVLGNMAEALFMFEDNKVVLPEAVIEELDNNKNASGDFGYNVRETIRLLEVLREKGKLTDGIELDNGGTLVVETSHTDIKLPSGWDKLKADNRILQVCQALKDKGEEVYLVTKDVIERIKADIIDIVAQDFMSDSVGNVDKQYKGRREIFIQPADLSYFYEEGKVWIRDIDIFDKKGDLIDSDNLTENEFLEIKSLTNVNQTALGQYSGEYIKKLVFKDYHPYGITARNAGQLFAIEALMKPASEVPLVILKGPAGTAKTFLALAVGLEGTFEVQDKKLYRKILACRPNILMDEELGFLPGDENEKIAPLMRPIYDNLEILVDSKPEFRYENEAQLKNKVQHLFNTGTIEAQAVGYLRGRSIPKTFIIIDEGQNVTPKSMKGILSRVGEGAKIVIMGDPEQVDHPYLSERVNGISYASEKMRGSKLCAQVTFDYEECQRSALAMEVSLRM